MSLCSCQYLQIYHIYLCGKKYWAPGTMGLMCRENWDGILSSTNVQRGFFALVVYWLWFFLLFISCHEKKKQNKHKPLACQHQREKNHLQQLYHNRSKQAASDFPVKSTRQKREKKSSQCEPLKNFSLLFLSLFLLQKGIYHRGF